MSSYLYPDMEERAERQKERDRMAEDILRQAREIRIKSLTHWALLSGGTLTLLVPFVQSLHKEFVHEYWLITSVGFLIIALILNSLGLYVTSNVRYHNYLDLVGSKNWFWLWYHINQHVHQIGIISYIVGILTASIFVGTNVF